MPQPWTNADGNVLQASMVSLEGSTGTFRRQNGQTFTYDITKLSESDQEVIQFIKAQLQTEPKLKHSPLLTRLRASGRACEQKRFASLYQKTKEDENG